MRIKASCCDPAKQCVGFNMIEISDERFMKLEKRWGYLPHLSCNHLTLTQGGTSKEGGRGSCFL